MDELISKRAAIEMCEKAIDLWDGQLGSGALMAVKESIQSLPSAVLSPEPKRKTGKWIPIRRAMFSKTVVQVKCSECGNLLDLIGVNCGRGDANYCPNCGARMEE